jgi:hypothetical protein
MQTVAWIAIASAPVHGAPELSNGRRVPASAHQHRLDQRTLSFVC